MHLRLYLVLSAAAFLLTFGFTPLHAQDSDDGLLRRGPHGPRSTQPSQSTPQQSALPPTQPTSQPVQVPTQQPAGTPTALNTPVSQRARVAFANGLLEVQADSSSLLQTLHDISRITGMSITGGVAEQRIFGDYGPASPATVLATLLDGTGTNMLLRQDPITGAPVELVLTQRAGGAIPINPNGPGMDDSPLLPEIAPAQPPAPVNQPSATNNINTAPDNALHPPNKITATIPGMVGAPNPPLGQIRNADGTTSPATPESIYQQLLQMQKAKAAASSPKPTPSPTPASPSTTPH